MQMMTIHRMKIKMNEKKIIDMNEHDKCDGPKAYRNGCQTPFNKLIRLHIIKMIRMLFLLKIQQHRNYNSTT